MDEKRSSGRSKKPAKQSDEGAWDCSVCTFKNSAEAYKCEMCDVRKGTSTRKPRINPQIVAQQVAQQFAAPLTPPPGSPVPEEDSLELEPVIPVTIDRLGPPPPPPKVLPKKEGLKRDRSKITVKSEKVLTTQQVKKKQSGSKLCNVDRTTARHTSVTVDSLTVVITDYQPKKRKISLETTRNSVQSDASDSSSNASNEIHDEHTNGVNHT